MTNKLQDRIDELEADLANNASRAEMAEAALANNASRAEMAEAALAYYTLLEADAAEDVLLDAEIRMAKALLPWGDGCPLCETRRIADRVRERKAMGMGHEDIIRELDGTQRQNVKNIARMADKPKKGRGWPKAQGSRAYQEGLETYMKLLGRKL